MGNKKRRLIIIAVVLIVGITTTAFAMPRLTAIIQRMSMSDSEKEIFDDLARMTTEEIIDEMNTILNAGYEDDVAMYHAMTLANRLDDLSEDMLLSESVNEENHPTLRYTLLQLYGEKMGNKTDSSKLLNIILDEDEDSNVRENAIYALPSDDPEIQKIIATAFFSVEDEGVAYHSLKYLWISNSTLAEKIADKVLADHENYSDERLCAAITAKGYELFKNNGNRTFDALLKEKDDFTNICIEIYEGTAVFSNALSEKQEYEAWKDPVRISANAVAQLGSEKSARYILDNDGFISENKLGTEITDYICRNTVRANYLALEKLAQTSNNEDDIELLLTATKYIPYRKIVNALQAKVENGSLRGDRIVFPPDFDGIYAETETNHAGVTSWEVMR